MRPSSRYTSRPLRSPSPDVANKSMIRSTTPPMNEVHNYIACRSPCRVTPERKQIDYERAFAQLQGEYQLLQSQNRQLQFERSSLQGTQSCGTCEKISSLLLKMTDENNRLLEKLKSNQHDFETNREYFSRMLAEVASNYESVVNERINVLEERLVTLEGKDKQRSPSFAKQSELRTSVRRKSGSQAFSEESPSNPVTPKAEKYNGEVALLKNKLTNTEVQYREVQKELKKLQRELSEQKRKPAAFDDKQCAACVQSQRQIDSFQRNEQISAIKIQTYEKILKEIKTLLGVNKDQQLSNAIKDFISKCKPGSEGGRQGSSLQQAIRKLNDLQNRIGVCLKLQLPPTQQPVR